MTFRLTQRLIQKPELDVILLLIERNGAHTPYQVSVSEEEVNLGNKFDQINPGVQEEVVGGVLRHYGKLCLNHPGDHGYLEIYDEKLSCLGSYQLTETGVTDSKGVITDVEKLDIDPRHQELLNKNYKSLETEIERERMRIE
ncbi:MAG: hypothetical protein U9Q06_04245 [Nanoarchaeota archaeon]|nr:hypothetical protein [Nanoarchaeota archaeon]